MALSLQSRTQTSEAQLMLTLRFLVSKDSQISLSYLFRIDQKSVSRIISETSHGIRDVLKNHYLHVLNNLKQRKKIAQDFTNLWQFPRAIDVRDGKYIKDTNSKEK